MEKKLFGNVLVLVLTVCNRRVVNRKNYCNVCIRIGLMLVKISLSFVYLRKRTDSQCFITIEMGNHLESSVALLLKLTFIKIKYK